jgi:hypothetical protein
MANGYWNGTQKAEFAEADILAAKIKNHNKFKYALQVMNNAFRLFYDARQLISKVTDARVKTAMTKELEKEVGGAGFGIGVRDFDDACKHVATNGGKWKDDKVSTMGWLSSDKICGFTRHSQIGYVLIPISLENFLEALNAKAKTLGAQLRTLQTHGPAAVNQVNASASTVDQLLPKVGSPQWKAMGDNLKYVKNANETIKALLWLASVDEHSKLGASSKNMSNVLGAIDKVRSGVENFDSATKAGYGKTSSVAFSAITEGLGAVPVLGKYYQEAFKLIPGITAGMTQIVQGRAQLFAQLGVDMYPQLR